MYDDDFMGWQLDDVLEGFEVDYAVYGIAIDSCGEPRDPLLDGHVRDRLDRASTERLLETPLAWKCAACGEVHPIDHEGIFCQCGAMFCCACEVRASKEHRCMRSRRAA